MTSGIYIIRNLVTDMIYIGSSVNIERRWSVHKSQLRKGSHPNSRLQRAWNKYGANNFEFQVTEVCDRDAVTKREQHWLDTHLPTGKCYNIKINTEHPGLGLKPSPETRQRLSEAVKTAMADPEVRQRISKVMKDRMSDPEVRRRTGEASKARLSTPESRQRMSEATKTRMADPEARQRISETLTGRTIPPEVRQRMSEAAIARSRTPEARQRASEVNLRRSKWYEFTHPDGSVSIVKGLSPFCQKYGLDRRNILLVIKGIRSHHKHFKCRTLSDDEIPKV